MNEGTEHVTLTRDQLLALIRAKTAELNTYREAVGLPLIYIHENAKRRRRRRTVTDSDRSLPSAGELSGACC